ncbi:hypothetical protein [Nostoc sp. ChiSLP03a]|nr:hypothetical protein [Nostoc sp. ChiSLP03a]MDZ8210408.1 hypothetical protein [Nostoc sp. ChiSLP03a]
MKHLPILAYRFSFPIALNYQSLMVRLCSQSWQAEKLSNHRQKLTTGFN